MEYRRAIGPHSFRENRRGYRGGAAGVDPLPQRPLLLISAQYFLAPSAQLFLHPVLEPRIALDCQPPLRVPPSAIDLDALSTQQAFASSLAAATGGHNLAMKTHQCSLLLLVFGWHPHHA